MSPRNLPWSRQCYRRSCLMTRYLAAPLVALSLVGMVSLARSQQAMLAPPDNHYFTNQGSWGQNYPDQWALKRIGLDAGPDSAWRLVKRDATPIVVAVVDTGLDWNHQDIDWDNLWHNPREIPGNGIDDDHNGYVDDIYGWNFIGGKDGRNVHEDSYEGARVYWKLHEKFGDNIPDSSNMSPDQEKEFAEYLRAKEKIVGSVDPKELMFMQRILPGLERGDSII